MSKITDASQYGYLRRFHPEGLDEAEAEAELQAEQAGESPERGNSARADGLLLSRTQAAAKIGISVSGFDKLNAQELVPAPIRLGTGPRAKPYWLSEDLIDWARWKCPSRARFEAMKEAKGKRKK